MDMENLSAVADEIINEYCKEGRFITGTTRSAIRNFVIWQLERVSKQLNPLATVDDNYDMFDFSP